MVRCVEEAKDRGGRQTGADLRTVLPPALVVQEELESMELLVCIFWVSVRLFLVEIQLKPDTFSAFYVISSSVVVCALPNVFDW